MATPQQIPSCFKTLLEHADITPNVKTQLTSALPNCQGFLISNGDANINFRVGGSGVAANKGAILFPQTSIWVAAGPDCQVWVCPESGSPRLSYTEAG